MPFSNRATDKATVLTFERRDAAYGGKKPPERLPNSTFEGRYFSKGCMMPSHNDSFAASGTSPTDSAGLDFRRENRGSIFLLYPLSESAKSWIEREPPIRRLTVWQRRSHRAQVYLANSRRYSERRIGGPIVTTKQPRALTNPLTVRQLAQRL